jgi:hypothetical protein
MPQCQFLFSAVFVFQKSYTGNILRIGRNKSRSSYFTDTKTESKVEMEEGQEAATPGGGTGAPLATPSKTNFGGHKSLFRHLPGWGISPGAISIDSTAISITVAVSHDEEGVVLPRG